MLLLGWSFEGRVEGGGAGLVIHVGKWKFRAMGPRRMLVWYGMVW